MNSGSYINKIKLTKGFLWGLDVGAFVGITPDGISCCLNRKQGFWIYDFQQISTGKEYRDTAFITDV